MKTLTINNFGIIKSANINLNGLTVISGNNDTGKSTIGKLFYTIIKSRKSLELNEDKKILKDVGNEIENLYLFLKSRPSVENLPRGLEYFRKDFLTELKQYIEIPLLQEAYQEDFNQVFSERIKILADNNLLSKQPEDILKKIKILITDTAPDNNLLTKPLNNHLSSEFLWDITPKQTDLLTKVKYTEGKDEILNFEIKKNKLISLNYIDDSYFDDATLIDAPLILQMTDMFKSQETNNNHISDLLKKISDNTLINNEQKDILDKLIQIVQGDFFYNTEKGKFYFSKNKNSGYFEALNSASGMQTFGLIQLLLKTNYINTKNLIIIDEPENHLHPEWQLKYAEIIIELIKNDISIILSTHSPYMLQALRHFGNKIKEKNKINFYLSEVPEDKQFAEIKEVTSELNKIFSKLAKPLTDLVWL